VTHSDHDREQLVQTLLADTPSPIHTEISAFHDLITVATPPRVRGYIQQRSQCAQIIAWTTKRSGADELLVEAGGDEYDPQPREDGRAGDGRGPTWHTELSTVEDQGAWG
jgi:hypothetical protein